MTSNWYGILITNDDIAILFLFFPIIGNTDDFYVGQWKDFDISLFFCNLKWQFVYTGVFSGSDECFVLFWFYGSVKWSMLLRLCESDEGPCCWDYVSLMRVRVVETLWVWWVSVLLILCESDECPCCWDCESDEGLCCWDSMSLMRIRVVDILWVSQVIHVKWVSLTHISCPYYSCSVSLMYGPYSSVAVIPIKERFAMLIFDESY